MTGRPSSRVALVTGASRGIGAAISRRLAADGMAIAINSHPSENMVFLAKSIADEIRVSGGDAKVYPADVSDANAVDTMFTQCENDFGSVEALVLNAAETGRLSWTEITESDWDRITSVNLKGAFLCCRRAFDMSDSQRQGAIVAISSVLAKVGATDSLHYATTKAGLIGFTRSLARELGHRGVRVNCVAPGAIQTEEELEAFPDQTEIEKVVLSKQILQRRGRPEDIADVVSFLTSQCSSFMTGQTLCVDGGWVLL